MQSDSQTIDIPWSANLHALSDQFGDATAIIDQHGRHLSYKDMCQRAHDLAEHLAALKIGPGDCVATLLPNSLDVVWATYGARLSGAAEAPLNWRYTQEEISWCAKIAGHKVVITSDERAEELRAIGLIPLTIEDVPRHAHAPVLTAAPASARSRIMFTSGTTGKPKAAVYTHDRRWIGEQVLKATLPFTPETGSRLLLMTPFSHGSSLLTFAWCDYGGEVMLLDGVNTGQVLDLLRGGDINAIFAPPTVLAKLVNAAGDQPIPGLQCIFTGTQPLSAALYKKACALFGPIIRITYGKAECFNPITVLEPEDTHRHFTSEEHSSGACLGWPAPGVEIDIRADRDTDAEDAQDGEVWLRARHMSAGMLDAEGFHAHSPDGWHCSGDLGHIDEQGRLVLTGRSADVIKTGGYRVNPAEIEACLTDVQGCGAICVTSIPSEYWGEIIIAIAEEANEGWERHAAERITRLSRHKHPRAYLRAEKLPRNAQGKVNRRQASQMALATHELTDGPYPELTRKS